MVFLITERLVSFRELLKLISELSTLTQGIMFQPIPIPQGLHISTIIAKAKTLVEKWISIRNTFSSSNYSADDWGYLFIEINRFNRVLDNIQWNINSASDNPGWMQHLVGARTLMGFLQSEINDHLPSTSSS
jgi:hypothetical protein